MNMPGARTFLVIEPNDESARRIEQVLLLAGASCRLAPDAEAGWRAFVSEPPQVVLTALNTPRRDGAWFIRRMRDEYLGALPATYALAADEELTPGIRELELDGVLLRPLAAEGLQAIARTATLEESAERQAARLRDLFELTLLGGDLDAGVKTFIDRVSLVFRSADCVIWGPAHEERWPKTHRPILRPEAKAFLLWRCDLALTCGATIIAAEGLTRHDSVMLEGVPARSYLAASLDAPGARSLGALCLVDDQPRRFTPEEREALRTLARRVAVELAWRAAHDRLVIEHDRLRETALLDPLLGVLTRAALEEALVAEVGRAQRTGDQLAFAILDIEQLRQINERYGHVTGDAVLAHMAQLVKSSLRPQDLVGRVAGDELALVLVGANAQEAHATLDQLRRTIQHTPLMHHGLEVPVQVKVGATLVAPEESNGDGALARAAGALRQAKRQRMHMQFSLPGAEPAESPTTGQSKVSSVSADSPVPDILPAGTTLGGMYQILHEISRGAMGVVYRAEDMGLNRPVAVKVLRQDLARDAELVGRFREEAAMLAQLHHENLVQVFAFGAQADDVYFVMELVEGEPLSAVLSRSDEAGEAIPVMVVEAIVAQVAGALDAMHRAGAIHRDVKPANILLDRVRERAVLVDVGVAKRTGGSNFAAAGTPGFAAPESFTGGGESAATDVYGLAATAYMMLTGLAPFGGGDVAKVVRRQLQDKPAAPSLLRAELSKAVDRVMMRALAPSGTDRYGGAQEFAHALGAALNEPPEQIQAVLAAGSADSAVPSQPTPPSQPQTADILRATTRTFPGKAVPPPPTPAAAPAPPSVGSTRGALFRVAYKILGNRLGSAWVRRACERDPGLSEVLRPTVQPLGWYPIERLIALLQTVPAGVRDPHKVARELGRATMTSTFARFFGADPSLLSPGEVLGATAQFWGRYHSWGDVKVVIADGSSVVNIKSTPREPLVCCLVEGAFERIAELAGATDAKATHTECETRGAPQCTFEVHWTSQPASS